METQSIDEAFEDIGFGKFQYLLIVIGGFIFAYDAVEMLILAFIQSIIKCVWQTNLWDESFLMAGVFIGMIVGSPIMGRLCDIYGRKYILVISTALLGYIGLLCAASPTIVWIIIFRTIAGACIGGVMSSLMTLTAELIPVKKRDCSLAAIHLFWQLGAYIITILCITIVPRLGWRMFLFISALPIVIILPTLLWFPESPRYLLLQNRESEALIILNRIAAINKTAPILNVFQPKYEKGSIWDLFHKNYFSTTLLTCFLWFVCGLTYYGMLLIVTVIDSTPRQCLQNLNTYQELFNNSTAVVDDSCCVPITWSNSVNLFVSITGELVFKLLTMLLVTVIGRRSSIAMFSLLISVLFVLMNICMPPKVLSFLIFLTRGSIAACFTIIHIYTSEVFPTSIRSLAFGICNTSSRVGAMLSPFINNFVIHKYSFLAGTMIFTVFNSVAVVVALILPYETKGRHLYQTADELIMTKNDVME